MKIAGQRPRPLGTRASIGQIGHPKQDHWAQRDGMIFKGLPWEIPGICHHDFLRDLGYSWSTLCNSTVCK